MQIEKEFTQYKENVAFKSLAGRVEQYFIDNELSPGDALKLLQDTLNLADNFKDSILSVKKVLNDTGVLKYREQYRQFKYRLNSKFVNLKIRKETYDKIKELAKQFDGVDDLLFEYAFDSRYYIDTSSIDALPTSLSREEKISVLLRSNSFEIQDLLKDCMQTAYKKGFVLGQETKKIRSKKSMNEALEDIYYNHDEK